MSTATATSKPTLDSTQREWLTKMGAALNTKISAAPTETLAADSAAAPPAKKGPTYLSFPGKSDKLVVLGERPLVAETPEHLLDDATTPTDKFYIRNNGQIPEQAKEPDKWKITIDGEVNKKLELTLGELKSKFKPVTRRMVLECGGNGRSFFTPQARGNQWTNGGAGCAEWTGVRVADVLKAAGVKYRAGKFPFMANARARAMEAVDGFVKILADAETDRVLGVHIVGAAAGDIIQECVVAMEFGGSAEDIARISHGHPGLSEIVKEAALAVDGRALHI